MPQEKIIIKFEPKGHPQLIQAINALSKAQVGLVGSQAKVAKANKDVVKAQKELAIANRMSKQTSDDLERQRKKETISTIKNKDAITANKLEIKKEGAARKQVLSSLKADILARNKVAMATKATTVATKGSTAATKQAAVASSLLSTRNKRLAATNSNLALSFATLRSKMLLISFGAMLIERAFVSLVKAYGRQEAANEKLRVGLGNVAGTTEGVTQRLVDYSAALQQTTAFGDEMITTGMVQFTTFGLNEKAIKALTPQVLNVARAIQTVSGAMPDLNSLFIAFGKATTTGIGTLTRYGVVLTEVERAQLGSMDANESAVKIAEILKRQYGGLAEAYAKTTIGMLEATDAARGDAAEAFGQVLAPIVLGMSKALKVMFEAMSPERITRFFKAVGIGAIAFGLLSGNIWKAVKALKAFQIAQIKTGWGAIAAGIGLASFALMEYFDILGGEGVKTLTDAQKAQAKLLVDADELGEAQEKSAEKLQNQLDLLNATNEVQKMRIQLGHEASGAELSLINAIVSKTEALKAEKTIMKELERQRKAELKLFDDIADTYDRNRLLRLEIGDATKQELALVQEEIRFKNELEKANAGLIDGNIISLQIGESWTEAEMEKIRLLAEEHGLILQIINANDELAVKGQEQADIIMSQMSGVTSAWSSNLNARLKAEIDTLKASTKYKKADNDTRKKMEKEKTDTFANEQKNLFYVNKAMSLADVYFNTASAVMKSIAISPLTGGQPWAGIAKVLGGIQAGIILMQKPPSFATGGMIGGRRHSQGGTMINAEAGEFVMSRSAVQSVGIENLNAMNAGGGGGSVTVNVSGNVLTEDFVSGELAENIKEAIRRGTDFGIS